MKTKRPREVRMLRALGACAEAIEWLAKQKSYAAAWRTCSRGNWMLWLAARLSGPPESPSRRKLVLAACECARLALPYVRAGEQRPLAAIETAEAWARGAAGTALADVRAAAAAAYAAAASSAAAYSADAPYSADASYSAAAAAQAAAWDAAAADAASAADAADAAADASDETAQRNTLAQCADIVRRHYPEAPKLSRK